MILTLAMIAAAIGGLVTLALAIAYAADPEFAMRASHHQKRKLPVIMIGRYAGFTALAFGAALYGDPVVILFLFVVFAGISFFDAYVYAVADESWWAHAAAGALCFLVIALAGVAIAVGA